MTFSRSLLSHLSPRLAGAAAAVLGLGLLTACGGGGGGGALSIGTNAISITSTAIAETPSGGDVDTLFESADAVDWVIPLTGGCGGPYVVKVVSGNLPPGISAVGGVEGNVNLHNLRGTILQHGTYNFRLEVTDTACAPFEFTTADFSWTIELGQVAIVTALPKLYAPGTYDIGFGVKNPLYPALPDTVFGSPAVVEFVIAGGVPPYVIDVVNDPNNADDEDGLPPGISIPPFSRNLVGSPIDLKDKEAYVFSIMVTDAQGQTTAPMTLQWEITAPPIIWLDDVIPDAKCGESYFMGFQIKDGVPPFEFRLVQSDVDRDGEGNPDVTYQAPLPPIITPATATAAQVANYPAANDLGPDYTSFLVPPEGVRFGDDGGNQYAANGSLAGIPRRRGTFGMHIYCFSTTAPTASGQHNWKYFELNCTVSEPPNPPQVLFGQDPAYTQTGSFSLVQPYATIADAEVGLANYNPDASYHAAPGLLLRAAGGVRKDGLTDAPNASQIVSIDGTGVGQEDGTTPGGGYDWTVDPNPAGDGDIYSAMPAGMTLDGWTGVWRVSDSSLLKGQQAQALEFTVFDQQLPTQLRNQQSRRVRFAIGPDKLIVTESVLSSTNSTSTTDTQAMHDYAMTVKVCFPYTGTAPVVRNLELGDLSATHSVPSTTGLAGSSALATLLTTQDIMRVCVSPTGWWDDVFNLNNQGARAGQHADHNGINYYYLGEYHTRATSDYSRQPSATAVAVPPYRASAFNAVSHSPATGVYTDGGRLYPFANASYIGVFMVRTDASIYVPFAIGTSQVVDGQTFNGFGDHQLVAATSGNVPSQMRAINMAVSPDGRFAAVKIKNNATLYSETANNSRIVLFSLTGEKVFGGQTWCILQTGSVGNATTGTYLYGASLVMTNSHLYYLCGNRYGTFTSATASREHFIYRFQFANPTTGAGVAGATGTGTFLTKANPSETNWTNTTSSPMQTRFQLFYTPWSGTSTYAPALSQDGQNLTEHAYAPLPFRVSHDGRAIAILAMPDVTNSVSSSVNSQAWYVWVDFQGQGARRLSSTPLHVLGGGTRGWILSRGASTNQYENWSFAGATTQLEISDDATKVAVVANRYASAFTTTESSPSVWVQAREDVIAYKTTDWVSWSELPVTGDNAGTNIFSAASGMLWRFGGLTFTKDNKGLVFWGGHSQVYGALASTSYQYGAVLAGTMYGTDISSATSITGLTVTSLLATADGGSSAGIQGYTTTSQYNPTPPNNSSWDGTSGVIKPVGGFMSRNREFLYIMNRGALYNGGFEHTLIGINVRSTNTATNVNGRTDFRGFTFSTWPNRRGFVGHTYIYYPYYGMYIDYYTPGHKQGYARQVMPKSNGWVFFASLWQSGGPYNYAYPSLSAGPTYPTYTYDYGGYGAEIEGFNADLAGPITRLSAWNSDASYRRVHFIEPFHDGSALAYIMDTTSYLYQNPAAEQLHVIRGISFGTGGTFNGSLVRTGLETSASRISDAIAFGSTSDSLYYGLGSTSNENTMQLKQATINSAGTASTRNLTSLARRYNVLFASR